MTSAPGLRNDERDDHGDDWERQGDPQHPTDHAGRAALPGFGCGFYGRREAAGPLTDLSNLITASLFSRLGALAQWVRKADEERPLISLLIAFEAGFAVARLGHRRAKH
jgi:hypothetical protein